MSKNKIHKGLGIDVNVLKSFAPLPNYYVSESTGNDAADGLTPLTAWETLTHVNAFAGFIAGDIIAFKAGDTWRDQLRIPVNGLNFTSYGVGNKPIFLGSQAAIAWTDLGGNKWQCNEAFPINPRLINGVSTYSESWYLELGGTIKWGAYKANVAACVAEFDWTWVATVVTVYAATNPAIRYSGFEVSQRQWAIDTNNREYISINNIEIHYCGYEGITYDWHFPMLDVTDCTITNCKIGYIGGDITGTGAGFGIDCMYSNMIVRDCEIYECGRRSISFHLYGSGFTVENILVEKCYFHNGYHTTGVDISVGSAAYTGCVNNIIIRRCLHYEDPASVTVATHHIFVQNYEFASDLVFVTNCFIYSNIFLSARVDAVMIEGIESIYIYNNTFYDHNVPAAGNTSHVWVDANCDLVEIKNNIFYTTLPVSAGYVGMEIYEGATQDHKFIDADYNLYYRITDLLIIVRAAVTSFYRTVASFDSLKAVIGWENSSPYPADPLFIGGGDLHLQAGSPAIATGLNLPAVTVDYDGNYKKTIPAIGAYEYLPVVVSSKYFVKNGGNDLADGLTDATAWANHPWMSGWGGAVVLVAGDIVQLKRGDTWHDIITTAQSGAAGNLIITGAYGTGAKPVISGFTEITGWVNVGGGIYSKVIACEGNVCNMVTVNGVNTPMGRFPNAGWLVYEAHVDNVSITDNELVEPPDWTGAEVVIRKDKWMLDRNVITNQVGTVITYTPIQVTYSGTNGYGYFFQNDMKCLDDLLGEWYYNGNTFYMYFGAVDPYTQTVKISTRNELLYINAKNYVKFENIYFEGANTNAIQNRSGQKVIIENCDFKSIGVNGIWIDNAVSANANMKIQYNTFEDCNGTAMHLRSNTNNGFLISHNIITNIGLIAGAGVFDVNTYDRAHDGIVIYGANHVIEYNNISHIGHTGICLMVNNYVIVRKNFITDWCKIRYDGAAIYHWASAVYNFDKIIYRNVCINSNQTISGAGADDFSTLSVHGIYCDSNSYKVLITYNVVSGVLSGAYNFTNCGTNTLQYNLAFDSGYLLRFYHDTGGAADIVSFTIDHNKYIAKIATQLCMFVRDADGHFTTLGALDYNYYARPIDDNLTIRTYDDGVIVNYNLAGWVVFSGDDVNSDNSPVAIIDVADLHFISNNTLISQFYNVSAAMIDVTGKNYIGVIELLPLNGLVLIGAGTVTLI
jgi:hypothetical protein